MFLAAACAVMPARAYDWLQFCGDSQHSCLNAKESTLNAANVKGLKKIWEIALPAATDAQPVFLGGVTTPKGVRDVVYVGTVQCQLYAVDAYTGEILWQKAPAAGRYVNAGPSIDPDREFIYEYAQDGKVHKFKVGDGAEVTTGGWPATVIASTGPKLASLSIVTTKSGNNYLYAARSLGGPSQGGFTVINLADASRKIFNTSCSNVTADLAAPGAPACQSGARTWSRQGATYLPDLDRVYMITGTNNSVWDPAKFSWPHTLLAIKPDGSTDNGMPLDNYSSVHVAAEIGGDKDMCSSGPGIIQNLPGCKFKYLAIIGDKSQQLRFINLEDMSGKGKPGQMAEDIGLRYTVPQGGLIYSKPTIWTNPADGKMWAFVGSEHGPCGALLSADAQGIPQLEFKWNQTTSFTNTMVMANGVLYMTDGGGQPKFWKTTLPHKLRALDPITGGELWSADIDYHHWSSPAVANGVVFVGDGKTGDQLGPGTLKAFSLSDKPIRARTPGRLPGFSFRLTADAIKAGLPDDGPATLTLRSLSGRTLLERNLAGALEYQVPLDAGIRGACVLGLKQGRRELIRRIHIDG
jgi:outer membrane protein assembly factor BamB